MDDKIWEVLDILSDYDITLNTTLQAVGEIQDDPQCDLDTMTMAEGVVIAVMIDKGMHLIPDDEALQESVLAQTPDLVKVYQILPEPLPLLYEVAIGYAVALSQSTWKWRPWERVRDFLLNFEDDAGDIPEPQ